MHPYRKGSTLSLIKLSKFKAPIQ
jgi:hypothetical protein